VCDLKAEGSANVEASHVTHQEATRIARQALLQLKRSRAQVHEFQCRDASGR